MNLEKNLKLICLMLQNHVLNNNFLKFKGKKLVLRCDAMIIEILFFNFISGDFLESYLPTVNKKSLTRLFTRCNSVNSVTNYSSLKTHKCLNHICYKLIIITRVAFHRSFSHYVTMCVLNT